MDPIGAHHYWGFSPAVDHQQIYRTAMGSSDNTGDSDTTPLNILLLQPGDPRSILKTIAQRSRHSDRPLHFFLFERPCEVLARDLLLLSVAVDWELPLRQRAATWLEIFGNALVQSRTSKYISAKRLALIDLLCNGRGPVPLGSVVDFESHLKFKERDELENIFKSYDDSANDVDMAQLREHRLRHNYGERYDFRTNLVDWDYQALIKKEAGLVHWTQYRDWRNSGVAFEYGDVKYEVGNRSLVSYVEGRERGRGSVARRGFWGDTVVSPFHAVGTAAYVPTDDEARVAVLAEELMGVDKASSSSAGKAAAATDSGAKDGVGCTESGTAKASKASKKEERKPVGNYAWQLFDITSRRTGSEQWRHHAVEIATYNLLSWLAEIETGRQYVMRHEHDVYSGLADAAAPAAAAAAATGEAAAAQGDAAATSAAAAPAPAPSSSAAGQMTAEEHAAVQAAARAAAVSRARAIARAFRNVKITLLSGDVKEMLAKGKLAPYGGMHVVSLSGRSVHHLSDPAFRSLLHPSGSIIVAETARNVPNLKAEQRDEFVRRVLGMAGRLGAALVGSDRQLSADTFAVGTVIDLNQQLQKQQDKGKDKKDEVKGHDVPGLPPSAVPFAYNTTTEGTFAGLQEPLGVSSGSSASSSGSSSGVKLSTVGQADPDQEDKGRSGVVIRTKRLGMASYSQRTGPLPIVGALKASTAVSGTAGAGAAVTDGAAAGSQKAAEGTPSPLALHLVSSLRTHILHVNKIDVDGGDNPRPEGLVFAYVAGAIADEVASAFTASTPANAALGGAGSSGSASGSASSSDSSAAAGGAGAGGAPSRDLNAPGAGPLIGDADDSEGQGQGK